MNENISIEEEFVEISSQQRVNIIKILRKNDSTLSDIVAKLGATKSEVHRNIERLKKIGILQKNDNKYLLTSYGKIIYETILFIEFVSSHKSFFQNHTLDGLPRTFFLRLDSFDYTKMIKGYVKVTELWKKIYQNSQEKIINILSEVPYSIDFTEPILQKLQSGVQIQSLFLKKAKTPNTRKEIFDLKFRKYVSTGKIQRKMIDSVPFLVVMNEKESCIIFSNLDGTADLSTAFYSDDEVFYDFCRDYFAYFWNKADDFSENHLDDN